MDIGGGPVRAISRHPSRSDSADDGIRPFIDVNMFDPNNLRAAFPQPPEGLNLNGDRFIRRVAAPAIIARAAGFRGQRYGNR